MKVNFDFSHVNRCTTVTAIRQEYDAPVLAPIEIFAVPYITLNHDRAHVAAALLFHREISGRLELDETITCSRHVAIQIARYFDPVDVDVRNQTLTACAIPMGSHVAPMQITLDNRSCPVRCDTDRGDMLIRFVPEAVGGLYSEAEVAIGTNLMQGRGTLDGSLDEILRLIGAATLFSEELQASLFRLPGGWLGKSSLVRLERVSALLSGVGLGLELDAS